MAGRVLVTGGASGIGAATAARLRDDGHEVVAADLAAGSGVKVLDVADEAAWDRLLDEVWPLTAVVNCAGVRTRAPLVELPVDEFDRLMAIHARGSFLAVRMPARRWLAAGEPGAVVTIASVVATHADRLGDPAQTAWLHDRVPAGRVGEAPEIAAAAAWLVSADAGYVTGVVLPVDGGWTAT